MRRRIALTMLAMVVGALALAGVGTFGLTVLDSVHQTQAQLVKEAREFAQGIEDEVTPPHQRGSLAVLRETINVLKAPLKLQGEALLAVRQNGADSFSLYNLLDPGARVVLPSGVRPDELNWPQLIVDQPVTGSSGRLAWAAYLFSPQVPVGTGNGAGGGGSGGSLNLVVVLTREAPAGPADLFVWFGLASAVTLAVALVVAIGLGRRIARPLQQTETVTRRIASGDLGARVELTGSEGAELVSLGRSVNHMADALSRAQGTQRQFLMSVSHDLRTPLTSIKGFAEALSDGTTTDVGYASGVISSEARRLERLVSDLLELAKLESGAFSLHLLVVDLCQVVTEAVQAFEPQAVRLGLGLRVGQAPTADLPCLADPDRLGQVVANVVENALKYAVSTVLVDVGLRDGSPAFTVTDDGPGIPVADLERVFQRLYQSRPATGRNMGSGLGLAIVSELVAAMGGRVWAEVPEDGAGTRIVVTLPGAAPIYPLRGAVTDAAR